MPIRLNFFDIALFSFMILGFVIGIHQSIYYGVVASYWLFMISMLSFLWLNKRLKAKRMAQDSNTGPQITDRFAEKEKKGKKSRKAHR